MHDDDVEQADVARAWQPKDIFRSFLNGDLAHGGGKDRLVMLPRPHAPTSDIGIQHKANFILNTSPRSDFLFRRWDTTISAITISGTSVRSSLDFGAATLTIIPAIANAQIAERNYPPACATLGRASKETTLEARLARRRAPLWYRDLFHESRIPSSRIYEGILQDNDGFYSPRTTSYAAFDKPRSASGRFRLDRAPSYERAKVGRSALYSNFPSAH